jgi:hypothetical protein
MSLKTKLTLLLVSVTTVLLVASTFISVLKGTKSFENLTSEASKGFLEQASLKLVAIRDNKKSTIEIYFQTITGKFPDTFRKL